MTASGDDGDGRSATVGTPSTLVRWAPFGLLLVSVGLGWVTTPALLDPERFRWSLLCSGALVVLRSAYELGHRRIRVAAPVTVLGYLVHLAILVLAVALNPFVCTYAFFGYLDADRVLGERLGLAGVVITGLVCGFGQAGGLPGVRATPVLFFVLAAVNVIIAMVLRHLDLAREKEVTARERAVAELARVQQKNAALQQQLLERAREAGVTEERSRLSRELHDTVAQGLVGVIRQLETLPADLDPTVRRRVERAERAARDCLTDARRAVRALGPQQLVDADLVDAVRAVAESWSLTHDASATVHVEGTPTAAPSPRREAQDEVVLRVVQEALANVAKHSGTAAATVTLSWLGHELIVDVRDDGCGFDPRTAEPGRGLAIMAERAEGAGGRLIMESAPGDGTTVSAALPR